MRSSNLKYTGDTPGADSEVYTLFNSVDAGWPKNWMAMNDLYRFVVDIAHAEAFDIAVYKSEDRGATWHILEPAETVAAPTNETTIRDFLVSHVGDFKVEITNGGAEQTTWAVSMHVTDQRVVAD